MLEYPKPGSADSRPPTPSPAQPGMLGCPAPAGPRFRQTQDTRPRDPDIARHSTRSIRQPHHASDETAHPLLRVHLRV